MRLRPALATLLLSSALVSPLLVTGAAHAETWSHRDAVRDVVALTEADGEVLSEPAPKDRRTDVRRITVAHSAEELAITIKLRDLAAGNKAASAFVRGPDSRQMVASMMRVKGKTAVRVHSLTEDGPVRCRGAEGAFRPRRDVLTLTIPTSCLDNPDWVRVQAMYATFEGGPSRAEEVKADDPIRRGLRKPGRNAWSPKIHVG
ncbi:hypothetical protein [Nocardioides lijunqiniae]|uniref:hypothetical protein n=1 Tax=Nocardioides lijunqiniae TaxID=2760832 RepID=UPI001877B729|nr:hypothetical protein [Nocardioides lijunqiniae]